MPKPGTFEPKDNGSGVVAAGGKHLAVDYSGASGAPLLLVGIGIGEGKGDGTARFQKITLKDQELTVMTLSKEKHPEAKVEGDAVVIGGQTIRLDGKQIVLGK